MSGRRPAGNGSGHETSRVYDAPHRPRLVRLTNRLGGILERRGHRAALALTDLLEAASRRNRLEDFGDESFREPLGRLLRAIDEEAALHPLGRWITRERLIGVLGNRLRVQRLLLEHPAIGALPLAPPLVITGLQRTGTTLLHRLLAADPRTRALASWEAINPAPFGWPPRLGPGDRRLLLARLSERALAYLAPDFFAIHPVEATAPEEDSLLLDFSCLSPVAEATLRVPSYAAWLAGQDLTPAYRYLALLLRLLQWQRPARRWVLKTPVHLEYLELLLAALPDAVVIQTHRDPALTLPSFCSMIAHGRGVFSDRVDPGEIGREWLARQSRMVRSATDARRREVVNRRVIDVAYADLVRAPLAQVQRIYDFAGLALDAPASAAMAACLRVNVQHRHGRHRYALTDFGLEPELVASAFAPYREAFAPWLQEERR